jgi:hypothetical protein
VTRLWAYRLALVVIAVAAVALVVAGGWAITENPDPRFDAPVSTAP